MIRPDSSTRSAGARPTRALASVLLAGLLSGSLEGEFVNWESPHVHPLELTPGGEWLLAVNTADARLELFAPGPAAPVRRGSIPVGLDPVTVRARSANEAWVVNQISDSISIVDLAGRRVTRTIAVCDRPADVVFAGSPARAFVSCPAANELWLFDPADPQARVATVVLAAEEPRALAVAAGGAKVVVAFFESGNATTILSAGRKLMNQLPPLSVPPDVVSSPSGPHGGANPPPNSGGTFVPPIDPRYLPGGSDPAPEVGLIVRRDGGGAWRDDTGADWTAKVSGAQAADSGRPVGWTMPDRDIALVDAASLAVAYVPRLMNLGMALGPRPDGLVTLVGTEALNQIRFEPNLKGRFARVQAATFSPTSGAVSSVVDLNAGHLTYSDAQVAAQGETATASEALRARSVGDPRAVVWRADGTRGYVAGMGSDNLIVIGPTGARLAPLGDPGAGAIALGAGPTGLAIDEGRQRLYVLERFAAEIGVVDLATEALVAERLLHDATPATIRAGRPFLYSTRATSGLGQVACGTCHVDGRFDRLAWDLGDPGGQVRALDPSIHNLAMGFVTSPFLPFEDFHPMKGPMVTQTLFDIIGKEPHHWRGDRDGLEQFDPAFRSLLGDDRELTPSEMQAFEDFLATLTFPPNPYRLLDNSLAESLPLPGHLATGRFALAAGEPLPAGDPARGLSMYRGKIQLAGQFTCVACHSLPTGASAPVERVGDQFVPIPPGPNGEARLGLVALDASPNATLKVPQIRVVGDKVGMETVTLESRAGFGFGHDGSIDSLARFMNVFDGVRKDRDVADLIAFLLSLPGSDLPEGSYDFSEKKPPGPASRDSHAAVGRQVTLRGAGLDGAETNALLDALVDIAVANRIGLVAHGVADGLTRGWRLLDATTFAADRASESISVAALRASATAGAELTFTAVPAGSETRLGVDRDEDGALDRDELDACGDPADAAVLPESGCLFRDAFEAGDLGLWAETPAP